MTKNKCKHYYEKTGEYMDWSYHYNKFQCKFCWNRIEELTGIWY